jgi:DNA-binding LacI/PurR family transcriptional regulator
VIETPSPPPDEIPLYRQIYRDLESKITTGELRYQEQIPVLPELCRLYGVSEAPVRRALDDLAREGFIVRQRGRGKGTFVSKRLSPRVTMRVLLMGEFDLVRSPVEVCHEIFDLLAGIRDAAREQNCQLQQVSVKGFASLPEAGPRTGYLIIAQSGVGYREGIALAVQHGGVPFVLVNAPWEGYPAVRVDMEHGAFLGTSHLAHLGHRRIAYIGATEGDWFAPRFAGYRRALLENGLDEEKTLVVPTGGIVAKEDEDALDYLLALPDPPTAVFACSDYRALHLLAHCKRRGINVPHRLSLCGYDNISEAESVEPALTSVFHPRYELGRRAVSHLSSLLTGDASPNPDLVLEPILIARATTALPFSSE